MRKISRYVFRTVSAAVGMVLLVVSALLFISALIDGIGDLGGNYTFGEMLIYVLLSLPRRIYEIIPFACLIGCLIGLGILASSSELVVMRAAGISVRRISYMVLRPVVLFIALGVALGEWVTPYTDQVAENRRAIAMQKPSASTRLSSMWNREGDEFMRFNAVLPNGVLYGVTRYKFDENRNLIEASFSEQAIYQGGYWQEEDVGVTYFLPMNSEEETAERAQGTRSERLTSRRWDTPLSPGLLNILVAEPEALSIRSLHYYVRYLREQNLVASDYNLAFWQKLLQPLATASLVLIAISFVFGPLRSVTMGQRIFTGVVFGVSFRLVQDLLGPSSVVFGFTPLIAVLLPIVFCLALGIFLLKRAG
jgi:lipopolysaccharide export system permease protein